MAGESSRKGGSDTLMLMGIVVVLFILTWVVIWFTAHTKLAFVGLYYSWLLLKPLDISMFPSISVVRNAIAHLAQAPENVTFQQLWSILGWTGRFYIPIPLSLATWAIVCSLRHRSQKIKRSLNADTLPIVMSKHAPAIIPVLQYGDMLNTNVAGQESRKTPLEFAHHHKLIKNGKLDIEKSRSVFTRQMGEKISSLDEMKPYEHALFAVFAIRVFGLASEARDAQTLLDRLNRSCVRGIPDYALAKTVISKYIREEDAIKLVRFFPYSSTLLIYLHREAFERGKLPSSHFRWLKPVDRALWYALNANGRPVPCVESIAQVQNFRWQEWAMDEGRIIQQIYLDDVIESFKSMLETDGALLIPVSSFITSGVTANEN